MAVYSDLNYIKPSLGGLIYDVNSIFQSVFSLLYTKKGERVFRPAFGLSLRRYLFEPCDSITAQSIMYELNTIMSLEPRVQFNKTKSSVTPLPNDKAFLISIVFTAKGFTDSEKTLNLVLRKD